MPKLADSDKKQNNDTLKRRGIHNNTKHSDGRHMEMDHGDLNNSPQNYETTDDEAGDSDEKPSKGNYFSHKEEVLHKVELQSASRKKLIENEKKSQKGKLKMKNASDLPSTTSASSLADYFGAYLLIIVLMLGVYFYFVVSTPKPVKELSLKDKLKSMQNLFQDQNHFTFRILETALNKVVNVSHEPSAPAIFTVTVNKNAIYKSHNFLHSLSEKLAPRSTVLINESTSWLNNPNDIKLKIDNEILSVAKSEKDLFVVIVDNLQNVPPKGAMIFHSYCDHEAAPYKQAVFLFIVPLDEILPRDANSKRIDKAGFQQLKNIWNYASSDEIDSLITRITVNVINIR